MGMYTGLRFKGIIKEEYREAIDELMNNDNVDGWEDVVSKYPSVEFMTDFAELDRSSFIPFGALAYMPDEWEESINPELGRKYDNLKDAEGWERKFDKETGYWQFQCSSKGYGTMLYFVEDICKTLLEKAIHVEIHYEEDRYGHLYELVNGEMVENEDLNVDYEPWRGVDEESRYGW